MSSINLGSLIDELIPGPREQERAWQRLQSNPKDSIKAAKAGSVADALALATHVDLIPPILTRETFQMFCEALTDYSPYRVQNPAHTVLCLQAIQGIGNFSQIVYDDRSLLPLLWNHWKDAVTWMRYNMRLPTDPKLDEDPTELSDGTILCTRVLATAALDDQFAKRMLVHPAGLDLAARLWIAEASGSRKGVSSAFQPYATSVLMELLRSSETRNAILDKLTSGKRNPDRTAKLALGCVRAAVERNEPSAHLVHRVHVALMMCSAGHAMHEAITEKSGILAITEAIASVAKRNLKLDESARAIIGYYLVSLSAIIKSLELGPPRLVEALRGGLLEIIARCSTAIESFAENHHREATRREIKGLLSTLIPQYLAFHSVIGATVAAFRNLPLEIVESRIDRSIFRDDWERLEYFCLDRYIYRQFLDKTDYLWGKQSVCANCDRAGAKNEFKACSGCKKAHYCSKECQVTAWKVKGHKTLCKLLAAQSAEYAPRKRDEDFVKLLARSDMTRHLPGLRALARHRYPGKTFKDIGFAVDYTVRPMRLGVYLINDEGREANGYDATNLQIFDSMRVSKDDKCLLKVIYAQGRATVINLFTLTGVELDEPASTGPICSAVSVARREVGHDDLGNVLMTERDTVDEMITLLRLEHSTHWFSDPQFQIDDESGTKFPYFDIDVLLDAARPQNPSTGGRN